MSILDFNYDKISEVKNDDIYFLGQFYIMIVRELVECERNEKMLGDYLCKYALFVCDYFYICILFLFYNLLTFVQKNGSFIFVGKESIIDKDESPKKQDRRRHSKERSVWPTGSCFEEKKACRRGYNNYCGTYLNIKT